jgi:hypothetical protein
MMRLLRRGLLVVGLAVTAAGFSPLGVKPAAAGVFPGGCLPYMGGALCRQGGGQVYCGTYVSSTVALDCND